jgi:hypothetical protein
MQNKLIRTLSLTFNLPIWGREVGRWRGAFIEMAGWEEDLCHNHKGEDGYHYRYPLVQYRCHRGKAAIFAVNEGVDALQRVLSSSDWNLNWDGQAHHLQIEDLKMDEHYLRMLKQPKQFFLRHWMALNEENYKKWKACTGLVPKVNLLQKLLENHVMASLWGLGWMPEERVEVQLQELERTKAVVYQGTKLMAFDVLFTSNVLLAKGQGIGKGVSHGFGAVEPMRIRPRNTGEQRESRRETIR